MTTTTLTPPSTPYAIERKQGLKPGTVNAQLVEEQGEKRYALQDIIGQVRMRVRPRPFAVAVVVVFCASSAVDPFVCFLGGRGRNEEKKTHTKPHPPTPTLIHQA